MKSKYTYTEYESTLYRWHMGACEYWSPKNKQWTNCEPLRFEGEQDMTPYFASRMYPAAFIKQKERS